MHNYLCASWKEFIMLDCETPVWFLLLGIQLYIWGGQLVMNVYQPT